MQLPENQSIEDLRTQLRQAFPDYKVGKPPFFKQTTLVSKGLSSVTIRITDGNLKCTGTPNTQHPGVMAALALGVVFGFLPAVLVLGVLYLVTNSKNQEMKQEVENYFNT